MGLAIDRSRHQYPALARIKHQYPALVPELEALIACHPELASMPLFLNTLWAILDECPKAFVRPLPPGDQGDASYLQTLTYLKNRRPTKPIVGWLADYQQKMQELALRFAGNQNWPSKAKQSLDLLLRCAQRVADYCRTENKRKRRPRIH